MVQVDPVHDGSTILPVQHSTQGRRRPRRTGGEPRTLRQSVASWPEAPAHP